MRLEDQVPPCMGFEYWSEPVRRIWSPGSRASGLVSRPPENCAAQRLEGKYQRRADQESIAPAWMIQWFSPGSAPWNPLASSLMLRQAMPAVTTSSEMWVESCQWWESGAWGSSEAEARWG